MVVINHYIMSCFNSFQFWFDCGYMNRVICRTLSIIVIFVWKLSYFLLKWILICTFSVSTNAPLLPLQGYLWRVIWIVIFFFHSCSFFRIIIIVLFELLLLFWLLWSYICSFLFLIFIFVPSFWRKSHFRYSFA